MNMCIVMDMNIYITKPNGEFLKSLPTEQSMSGLVNDLLDNYRSGKGTDIFPQFAKSVTAFDEGKPISMVGKLPDGSIGARVDSEGLKFCKHGSDPKFCKFAKPGMPCK